MLVYFMLQNELPFGSWRDNELDTFGKIVGRHMALPSNLSSGAIDLIDKVKIVYVQTKYIYFLKYEEHRIGLQSYESMSPHHLINMCRQWSAIFKLWNSNCVNAHAPLPFQGRKMCRWSGPGALIHMY